MSELKVVSIDKLREFAKGEIVELPGFIEDEPFVVRLKKPSMLALVKMGKIPNSLLVEANKLFSNGVSGVANNVTDENMLSQMMDILEVICKESFVEPTYKQIEEAGLHLTDQQLIAVFSYTQNGVEALKPFRK